MNYYKPRRPFLSLRLKLLLVSLSVLTIPWIGYEYLREMEVFLQQGQENALLATARAVAAVLHNHPELFQQHTDLLRSTQTENEMFIPVLRTPIILDGQIEDWKNYLAQERLYAADNVLESKRVYRPESLSFRQIIGVYERYVYTIFIVQDDKVVYRAANSYRLDQCDHLQIALQGPDQEFYRYRLATQAPGWVNAHLMSNNANNPLTLRPEVRIKGAWREINNGYILELRIPISMVGARIAFAIADVDNPTTREISAIIGTAGTRRIEELGVVIVPSPEIERILKDLERGTERMWVVDHNKRVLALAGSLRDLPSTRDADRNPSALLMHALYRLILPQPSAAIDDKLSGVARLEGQEIEAALAGIPQTRWRKLPDRHTAILSALLAFASRFSSRIRRLRDEAERATGPNGRVRGRISGSFAPDEVGDLARSFSTLLDRIAQYTHYLEEMAGRLSHELRTPLAVVKSSLENLEIQPLSESAATYTRRAREGVARLTSILSCMSEASRLEQMLQRAETEDFALDEVIRGCVEGYRIIYPQKSFVLELPPTTIRIRGVPELIAQMIDKLVSNAVDFSSGDDPILLQLTLGRSHAILSITDYGTPLPDKMEGRLFESMVSIRIQRGNEPHLGIGLYIVRLITEFHGGVVEAHDLVSPPGARFTIHLPLR